jgi:AcrR family transcriptional regulator
MARTAKANKKTTSGTAAKEKVNKKAAKSTAPKEKVNKKRAQGIATKEKLYETAIKVFTTIPYESATVVKLEKAFGLTRGAIFYHEKNKHELFQKVVEKYLISGHNIYEFIGEDILEKDITLLEFINLYTDVQEKRIDSLYAFSGVNKDNIDKKDIVKTECAYLRLLFNAGYYIDNYNETMDNNFRADKDLWTFFIRKAIDRGEVKPNTDAKLCGELLTSIYLGQALHSAFGEGINFQKIKKLYLNEYNKIKI